MHPDRIPWETDPEDWKPGGGRDDWMFPERLGKGPKLEEDWVQDVLDVIAGDERTPEGIELYSPYRASDSDAGLCLVFSVYNGVAYDGTEDSKEAKVQIREIEVYPQIIDAYRGVKFAYGWSEELRNVVFWSL